MAAKLYILRTSVSTLCELVDFFFLQLQARINSSLLSKPGLLSSIGKVAAPPAMPSKPMPLILDDEGRTVDSSGRTVQLSIKHSTAQVC